MCDNVSITANTSGGSGHANGIYTLSDVRQVEAAPCKIAIYGNVNITATDSTQNGARAVYCSSGGSAVFYSAGEISGTLVKGNSSTLTIYGGKYTDNPKNYLGANCTVSGPESGWYTVTRNGAVPPQPEEGTTYDDKDKAAEAMPKSDFTSSDLTVDDSGNVTASKETASEATGVEESKLVCFPVVTTSADTNGGVVAISLILTGDSFQNVTKPSNVRIYKLLNRGEAKEFSYRSDSSTIQSDEKQIFTIIDTSTEKDATEIKSTGTYRVKLYVKDGGDFDLDGKADGSVIDPAAMDVSGSEDTPSSGGSGSSGGCNAGFGALALAAVAIIAAAKRRNK